MLRTFEFIYIKFHFVEKKFPHNFSTQNYFWIQRVYFYVVRLWSCTCILNKTGSSWFCLRSIQTWQYIQKKCKNQPFQSVDKLQKFSTDDLLRRHQKKKLHHMLWKTSWNPLFLLLMLTCLQGLHPHSLLSTFLPPILTAPFPLRLLLYHFLPLCQILLFGELCIFSYVGQFSFSHCFIPQHGAPGQHQNSLRTPKMPNIKQRFLFPEQGSRL